MRNIYLDFDGTIVDSSARLYAVYQSIMAEFRRGCLPKNEYWDLKKERQPYDVILAKTGSRDLAAEYMKKFLQKIESPEFLKCDTLLPGVYQTLSLLKKGNRLAMVTLRRSRDNLCRELKDLKIFDLFEDIFDNFIEGTDSWKIAAESVRKDPRFVPESSVIVGDTEDTILAGRDLRIPSFVVSSGIRSESFLKKYDPGYLLRDINELPEYLSAEKIRQLQT